MSQTASVPTPRSFRCYACFWGKTLRFGTRGLLQHLNRRNKDWNMLTLNSHLSSMYDLGLIGLCPTRIASTIGKDGFPEFSVYFELHFLGPTEADLTRHSFPVSHTCLAEMCTLQDDYRTTRRDAQSSAQPRTSESGAAPSSASSSPTAAGPSKCFDCLALSWTARMVLFLAGGAGHARVDLEDCNREKYPPDEYSLDGCGCCQSCSCRH